MKILFLVPYPLKESPSQRFRFEQYLNILLSNGFSYQVQSFVNSQNWQIMFSNGKLFLKLIALLMGFSKRFLVLFKLNSYDFVFIHRESAPVGPPIFEWFIAKVLRKKIIYDFDDSIWLTDKVNEGKAERMIRWRSKVKDICRWSYKVSCGNEYLCDFARQFNSNVLLNPTTIDTENLHNPGLHTKNINPNQITIGWTGSHSTLKYIEPLVPVIQALENRYHQIQFLVIANKKPVLDLKSLVFVPWSAETEIKTLLKIDIGVMPLPDDEWSRGKCGFKALQYMALEIPALVSPVGVNTKIVEDGFNGFLCSSQQEWMVRIEQLINNSALRISIGKEGKTTVDEHYSVVSNSNNFLSLFA